MTTEETTVVFWASSEWHKIDNALILSVHIPGLLKLYTWGQYGHLCLFYVCYGSINYVSVCKYSWVISFHLHILEMTKHMVLLLLFKGIHQLERLYSLFGQHFQTSLSISFWYGWNANWDHKASQCCCACLDERVANLIV